MKTERAIELLNRISDSQFDGEYGDERREALSMAVRALESNLVQESGDLVQDLVKDCISRKMAIDEVKRLHDVAWANWKETRISANTMIDALKDLPSAQPERPEQPESAKEYCAECDHIEMCRWYPYEGCEFRSLPSAQPVNYGSTKSDSSSQLKLNNDSISRQAAIDAVAKWFYDVFGIKESDGTVTIFKKLRDIPSAQSQRKKGKWITVPGRLGNEVECNKCHSVFWYWMGNYRFCPSCGADMRGENE